MRTLSLAGVLGTALALGAVFAFVPGPCSLAVLGSGLLGLGLLAPAWRRRMQALS